MAATGHAIVRTLRHAPSELIWLGIGLTRISYATPIARDWRALKYAGARIPAAVLLLGSWQCGCFGKLAGAAVRSRVRTLQNGRC